MNDVAVVKPRTGSAIAVMDLLKGSNRVELKLIVKYPA